MRWPCGMGRAKNESDIKPVSDVFTGFMLSVRWEKRSIYEAAGKI